ncbi:MAG: PilZ domain-containing protein [Desulfuromonadales bacterium]|nr:PilZ domain-containing protein [Desulfuromonadales bacterium]
MESEKQNFRTDSNSHCLLMGIDGVTYQALLGDLSLTGALIKMSDKAPHGLHVGEMCGLMLNNNTNMSFSKHTGMIVELDSGNVVISFHHQEHRHRKHTYSPPAS